MVFKVMAEQCDQCLFSKSKIVSDLRRNQLLRDCAKKDAHFICHKATEVGQEACCRVFFDTRSTNLMRIARRLGAVEYLTEADFKKRAKA